MNQIMIEDLEYIVQSDCIPWKKLANTNILITGATGLIGSTVVKALLCANQKMSLNLNVFCIVRDLQKAERIFGEASEMEAVLHYVIGDVTENPQIDVPFDYIIHGASPTASAFFVSNPVETIATAIKGTSILLSRAKKDGAKGFLFLSSMEAYGHVGHEQRLTEEMLGTIDLSNVRNCYPESKRICEMLCTSYADEYQLPAMSIRLAQTFGPGVAKDDKRVFAMMARCVMQHEDIVLLTKGTSRRPYLYTAQAAEAILCVLLCGAAGQTYNVANPQTYCSIYEMGEMVAEKIANGEIAVKISETNENKKYPPAGYLNLDISKISALGWKPSGTLKDMYLRMMAMM